VEEGNQSQEEGDPSAADDPEAAQDGQSLEEDGSDFGYDMYDGGDVERNDEDAEPEYDAEDVGDGEDLSESGESVDSEDEHALAVPLQTLQAVLGSPQSESMAARQEQQNGEFDAQEGDDVDSFDSPFPPAFHEELVLDSSLDLSPVYPPSATSEEVGLGEGDENPALDQESNGGSNGDSERTPLAASAARRGMPLPRHPANRSPTSPTVADLIDHFSSPLLARSADRESRRLSRRKDSLYM
jgi:hypothetical protein